MLTKPFFEAREDSLSARNARPVSAAPQMAAPAANPGTSWGDWSSSWDSLLGGIDGGSLAGGFANARITDAMREIAGLAGFQGDALLPRNYTATGSDEGGEYDYTSSGNAVNPALLEALQGYSIQIAPGEYSANLIDPTGVNRGSFTAGDKPTGFDKFVEKAIPLTLAAMGVGAMGGWIPGTEAGAGAISGGSGITAGGSAGYGSIGGTLGGAGGTTLGVAGGGMSAGAGLNSALLSNLGAAGVGSVLPAAMTGGAEVSAPFSLGGADAAGAVAPEIAANGIPAAELGYGGFEGPGAFAGIDAAAEAGAFIPGAEYAIPASTGGLGGLGSALSGAASSVGQFFSENPTLAKIVGNVGGGLALAGLSKGLAGDSGDMPAVPDYAKLQQEQTTANQAAQLEALQQNRMDTTTPYGSQTYGRVADPSVPGGYRYTQNISLNPQQQELLDKNTASQIQSADMLTSAGNRVNSSLSQPLDFGTAPALRTVGETPTFQTNDANSAFTQSLADAVYNQQKRYSDVGFDDQKRALESRLGEQGFVPGTPAYDNAMKTYFDTRNRAEAGLRDSATIQGFSNSLQQQNANNSATANRATADVNYANQNNNARSQSIAEILSKRQTPLNELASLRSGAQVTNPQTTSPYMAQPYNVPSSTDSAQKAYDASIGQYNVNTAASNNLQNNIFGLGTAALNSGSGSNWLTSLLTGLGGNSSSQLNPYQSYYGTTVKP